jgi:deoxyhypusine monooxygenase
MAPVSKLRECLIDISNPIAKRTHVAFLLRTLGTAEAASVVAEALKIREDTPLMRHELAYILGQMQQPHVCGLLTDILSDEADDVLVRHECAEALGAMGNSDNIEILKKFSNHSAPEIAETCQIAIDLINWRAVGESAAKSDYLSVDPAPSLSEVSTVDSLLLELMDTSKSLFHRYRAMFSLRNMNNDESALALVKGFADSSALFRHEVAYVLGQMQRAVTVPGLTLVLQDKNEHRMVRHEAAEAMGAIGGEEVERVLREYTTDGEQVVEESCLVALNTIDYWTNGEFSE